MTPQRKKALSYANDGRNTLAEARSKAHKAIAKRKALANRALRHAQALATAAAAHDPDLDTVVARTGNRSWRKVPDAPLAVYVSARLGGANLASKRSGLLRQGEKSAKVRSFVMKGPIFNGFHRTDTMISRETAQAMVLRRSEGDPLSPRYEKFAVQSCELSARGDYWIVRVNSEAYVLHGRGEHCYVGVNAHLVDVASGEIETVGSGQSVASYLQQKYDIESAAGMHYTLQPTFDRSDKAAIIRVRQALGCSLQSAMRLAMPGHRHWLTGPRYVLQAVQARLAEKNIGTEIVVLAEPIGAAGITTEPWFWEDVKFALKQTLCVSG